MTTIRLKSSNDEVFEVDLKVVKMSETLKTMLENMGSEDDGEIISLPKVSSEIMRLIIKWSTYRVDTPPARETEDDSDSDDEFMAHNSTNIDAWDKEFLEPLDTSVLFELLMACNYLDIRGLIRATAKTIANMIKGKSPEDIRQVFQVNEDTFQNDPEIVFR